MWAKDLRRVLDYVETRADLDPGRVALYGLSWGAVLGPLLAAVEDRIRVALLVAGGLVPQACLPEADPYNFAPLVRQPTLMVNGQSDFFYPLETSQRPLFQILGSADKRHAILDSGHLPPLDVVGAEMNTWMDQHLGPVR
jgi:dienelactone hydrolase